VWRASGKEKLVASPRCKLPVGAKRTLVFCHRGGKRTDWLMHEYRLLPAGLLIFLHGTPSPAPPHVSLRMDSVLGYTARLGRQLLVTNRGS
jgi:hypothetical protein